MKGQWRRWRRAVTVGIVLFLLYCASPAGKLGRVNIGDLEGELARRANSKSGEKSAEQLGKDAGPRLSALEKLTDRELLEEIRLREKVIYGTSDVREVFQTARAIPNPPPYCPSARRFADCCTDD